MREKTLFAHGLLLPKPVAAIESRTKVRGLKPIISDENWFATGSFSAFKKPAREPFEIAKKDGVIQTLEGPVKYSKGFYIITGPKGEKYPVSPESFFKLKVDNGGGTASPIKIVKMAKEADHAGKVKTSWGETLKFDVLPTVYGGDS